VRTAASPKRGMVTARMGPDPFHESISVGRDSTNTTPVPAPAGPIPAPRVASRNHSGLAS
jgi:hypothetical protein